MEALEYLNTMLYYIYTLYSFNDFQLVNLLSVIPTLANVTIYESFQALYGFPY